MIPLKQKYLRIRAGCRHVDSARRMNVKITQCHSVTLQMHEWPVGQHKGSEQPIPWVKGALQRKDPEAFWGGGEGKGCGEGHESVS